MSSEVPEGWQPGRFGQFLKAAQGGGTPRRDNPAYWGRDLPWASVKDVTNGASEPLEHITAEGLANSSSRRVAAGTNILAMRMAVGSVVRYEMEVAINQDLLALVPADSLDSDFLFHWLRHHSPQFADVATGTTVKGLRKDILLDWPILVPPLDEQRRIAEVLRSVDEAIGLNYRTAQQAECALTSARLHLTGLDGSESGWLRKPVLECFQLQRGHDLPVQNRNDGGVPVIASNGPVGFHDYSPIPSPAVITGRSGTIGKVTYFDGPCWPLNTTLFVRDFKGSDPRFVYHFLSAFPLAQHATGTGVPTLNRNDVHAVEVRWPEPEEQDRRAKVLDSLEMSWRAAQAAHEACRSLKVKLAADLLSGRVRVPA